MVHPNTFSQNNLLSIPIPYPIVPSVSKVTQSCPSPSPISGGLVSSSSAIVGSLSIQEDNALERSMCFLEDNPDTSISQVPDLQPVTINSHPMQTRSKSSILKKKSS